VNAHCLNQNARETARNDEPFPKRCLDIIPQKDHEDNGNTVREHDDLARVIERKMQALA
jgi:hypothetical protein